MRVCIINIYLIISCIFLKVITYHVKVFGYITTQVFIMTENTITSIYKIEVFG